MFERRIHNSIMNAMKRYPNAQVLDIGANIGVHSLFCAKYGRKVVSVEIQKITIDRFHKAALLNNLQDSILLENGISNERGYFSLNTRPQGPAVSKLEANTPGKQIVKTIYMDDMLQVIDFDEAIMKIDIEA